jgi:hypothetical protein
MNSSTAIYIFFRLLLCMLFTALTVPSQAQILAQPSCGLTIISHGAAFVEGLPLWMNTMASEISSRQGGGIPIYQVKYHTDGSVSFWLTNLQIDLTQKGSAILMLDWSSDANPITGPTTQVVADAFYDFIFGTPSKWVGGHNPAEIAIHLIGHSRGGSLVSRLAQRLGESGVTIDQMTTLDPHPVTGLYANDWPTTAYPGETLTVPYWFINRSSGQTVTFFLDDDTNPYNSRGVVLGTAQNAASGGIIGSGNFNFTAQAAHAGTHYVGAMAQNNPADFRVRYDYLFSPITLADSPPLVVSPSDPFSASGPAGGPFGSATKTDTVTGDVFLCFISDNASWLDVTDNDGSPIDPGLPFFVGDGFDSRFTATINSAANSLPPGTYTATITVEGVGAPVEVPVNLIVGSPPGGNTGTYGGFSYQWSVSESGGNYTGTAVLTSYSGSAAPVPIPHSVPVLITIRTGAANQEYRWVNCNVTGFSNFELYSTAHWTGEVNVIGNFNLNANHLTIGTPAAPRDRIHQSGALTLGGGRLEITGDYLQQRDADNNGSYEAPGDYYCYLAMTNAADRMTVGGKAQFWSRSNGYSYGGSVLTAGVLEVKGDFVQKGTTSFEAGSFYPSGTHRTKLSGTAAQAVSFDSPSSSFFKILEVTNPNLADTSTISVAGGGNMQLKYLGTDLIGALYLGGNKKADGVYDSTHSSGLITGTGRIQVGPFADYAAWAAANALGQTAGQDHDRDGVSNGIEYFMGKTGNDFTANPGIAPDGTVTWPKSPAFSGSYAVQVSVDLNLWTEVTDNPSYVTQNLNSITCKLPSGGTNRFVRLVVSPT